MTSTSHQPPVSDPEVAAHRKATDSLLIDTDVHEYLKSSEQLLPYLDAHWARYVSGDGGVWSPPWLNGNYAIPVGRLATREEWIGDDGTRGTSVDALAEHLLEGEGVSTAILTGLFHASRGERDYEFMAALASAYNDWQVAEWLEREPRLRGSVHVVAHMPELAAREIDRVAEHPQIVQVHLPTVTNRQYGDPFYDPIYEAALRNDLAVSLHHGVHTETVLGYPRYYIEWHMFAAPHAGQAQLASLICNGTFDRFPDLKLVLLETGVSWLPWFMWRLDQQYREMRANVPWVKRLPSEHIRDNVRVATQPATEVSPKMLVELIEMMDTDRVYLFATDYPHYDADSVQVVLPGQLDEGLRRRIRYENAIETFPRLRNLAP
ncbi:MAG TPA: amidohydrolase family protein [Solirubrobacterales bacterium]|jgi:predicted TIM-barrel fold metal-dependent hydrolase|nr:amidohydrolase family protein [Solirubrobacterales bacterium]